MRADGRFDGHIVQGHVDGIGRVREMKWLGESAEITIEPPAELERYLVEKGSVCGRRHLADRVGASRTAPSRSRSSRIHCR